MSKLQKKEIAFAVVSACLLAVIIFTTAAIPTWAYFKPSSSRPKSITPTWYFGGKISKVIPAGTCSCPNQSACPNGCPCGFNDVTIEPLGNSKTYICPSNFDTVYGTGLVPGAWILGFGTAAILPTMIWTAVSS